MKNIFKFNRVFSVLLLLSVANSATAGFWDDFTDLFADSGSRIFAEARAEAAADKLAAQAPVAVAIPKTAADLLRDKASDAITAKIAAELPPVAAPAQAPVAAPAQAPVAATSMLSSIGSFFSEASRAIAAKENRNTVYVVAGIAATCAVGFALYKRSQAKKVATVSSVNLASVETLAKATNPISQPQVVPVVAPVALGDYVALLKKYNASPVDNKAALIAIEAAFGNGSQLNALTIRTIAQQLNLDNSEIKTAPAETAVNIKAKLTKLIAA